MATSLINRVGEENIINPKPGTIIIGGETLKAYPLPDKILVTVMKEIEKTVGELFKVGTVLVGKVTEAGGDVNQTELENLPVKELAELLPMLWSIVRDTIIGNARVIIQASLRVDDEFYDDNFYVSTRLEALRVIFEAENIGALLGELSALVSPIKAALPGGHALSNLTEALSTAKTQTQTPSSEPSPSPNEEQEASSASPEV